MFRRLLARLLGRKLSQAPQAPVPRSPSPPRPATSIAPPPPPPPPPAPSDLPPAAPAVDAPAATQGRVSIILEDGTRATPRLDPEEEDRLRYLVENLVPPEKPPEP